MTKTSRQMDITCAIKGKEKMYSWMIIVLFSSHLSFNDINSRYTSANRCLVLVRTIVSAGCYLLYLNDQAEKKVKNTDNASH